MHQLRTRRWRIPRWDWGLLLVTVVAAIPRLYQPGMYILWWDEVLLLRRSLRLVALHEWTWLSNSTTWSAVPIHSPFNTYAFALPYLVSTDPRVVRLFVGVLGTLAVIVLFLAVRRYFNAMAALFAGLLLALSPTAIDWARWVWNPNLAQVFIALWLLTGLMGYFEGKRWAQIALWLMLSFAGQAHLGHGFNLVPPTLVFLAIGWWRFPDRRREILRNTSIAWLLLALSLIPWIIGLLQSGVGDKLKAVEIERGGSSFEWIRILFSYLTSSTRFWTVQRAVGREGEWWPPLQTGDHLLWIKTWITLLGGIWLLARVWRKRWQAVPGAMCALLLFWPLISVVLSPIALVEFYLMPIMFGAYAVQGIVLAQLAQWRTWARWPVFALVALFLVLQGWLVVGIFRWYDVGGETERYRAPINTYLSLLESWRDDADRVVVLTETDEFKYSPEDQMMWWEVIGGYDGPEIVMMPQGIPIHSAGQVLVSAWPGRMIPTLFGPGEPQGVLNNGEPMFRKVTIPAGYSVPLDYEPVTLNRFANGAQILGLHALEPLEPGASWPVVLAWSPDAAGTSTQYQFSLRVMSGDTAYGQLDMPALDGDLWPPGELVVNLFEISVAADMPLDDVRLQLVMYSWPDMATMPVTDADGNPIEPWLFLAARDE